MVGQPLRQSVGRLLGRNYCSTEASEIGFSVDSRDHARVFGD